MIRQWARAATFVAVATVTCVAGVARAQAGSPGNAPSGAVRAWGEGIVISVESAAQRVSGLLRKARAAHDAPHAACANEALSRLNASLRTARASAADLGAAEARGDTDAVRRASAKLVTAREGARNASNDVDACYAIDHGAEDRTIVQMRVDPDVAQPAPTVQ